MELVEACKKLNDYIYEHNMGMTFEEVVVLAILDFIDSDKYKFDDEEF